MLWMPLNWSVLFVSLVVAESRKHRPADQEMFRNIDKYQLFLSLMTELQNSYTLLERTNEKRNWILLEGGELPESAEGDISCFSVLTDLSLASTNFKTWLTCQKLISATNSTTYQPMDEEMDYREMVESENRKTKSDVSSWGKYPCSWRIGCLVICLLITLKRDYLWKRKLESSSMIDASVQCSIMSDWPEAVPYVPCYAPLREDDLETDASGRKCSNFYRLPGSLERKYELIRKLSKYLAVGEAISRVGILLGLTATDICIIKQDYKGDSMEIAYRCLKKWTEIRPSEGRQELEEAIVKAGLGGILQRILN